jgi:hypothetical protein
LKKILRVVGILIAIWIGFFVILIAMVYMAAWWTGRSPAFYWP